MSYFHNHAARIRANTIASVCQDLGMTRICRFRDGTVSATFKGVDYVFGWDSERQQLELIFRYDPANTMIATLVAS